MEGTLRVTPQQLTATATEFKANGSEITQLTSNMTELVNGLSSFWNGEAAEAFKAKYRGLEDDIQKLIKMVDEHAQDLIDMAQKYTDAESTSQSDLINNLSSDVIV